MTQLLSGFLAPALRTSRRHLASYLMQGRLAVSGSATQRVRAAYSSAAGWPAAAAAAPAVSAPGGPAADPVPMDITRENFKAALPLVKEALERCSFFAFDCEMTGLFLPNSRHYYLDDIQERYAKVRASAAAFQVTQFGLSCFEPASSGGWQASTFNFWVFPSTSGRHAPPTTFSCEASSMAFLADQGFDFNTWARRGVTYLPLATRDALAARVHASVAGSRQLGELVSQANDADRALLEQVVVQVQHWMAAGDTAEQQQGEEQQGEEQGQEQQPQAAAAQQQQEDTEQQQPEVEVAPQVSTPPPDNQQEEVAGAVLQLQLPPPSLPAAAAAEGVAADVSSPGGVRPEELLLPPMNGWQRLLVYEQLKVAPWAAPSSSSRGVWVNKAVSGRLGQLRVVRVTAAQAADLEAAELQRRLDEVEEAAGFAAVVGLMRDCGKPAVGHNLMFDLAYTLHSFATGALPEQWAQYKQLVQAWFPGGVYDTKYLAQQSRQFFQSTALGELYQELFAPTSRNGCCVAHAPGYSKYQDLPPGAAAHEAGYDAFMTGACFAALLGSQYQPPAPPGADADPPEQQQQQEEEEAPIWVQAFKGRTPLGRSDVPYATLFGEDPLPHRPCVFLVQGLATQQQPMAAASNLLAAALGAQEVALTPLQTRAGLLMQVDKLAADVLHQKIAESPTGMLEVELPASGVQLEGRFTVGPWTRADTQEPLLAHNPCTSMAAKRPADGYQQETTEAKHRRLDDGINVSAEPSRKPFCTIM